MKKQLDNDDHTNNQPNISVKQEISQLDDNLTRLEHLAHSLLAEFNPDMGNINKNHALALQDVLEKERTNAILAHPSLLTITDHEYNTNYYKDQDKAIDIVYGDNVAIKTKEKESYDIRARKKMAKQLISSWINY